MANLKIKSQTLPSRCEICHQSDLFDSATNSCRRCSGIVLQSQNKPLQPMIIRPTTPSLFSLLINPHKWKILTTFALSGMIAGFIFDHVINIEAFETFWFYFNDQKFLPTWKYYFFAGLFFQLSIWLSYGLSNLKKWIDITIEKEVFRRWLAIFGIQIGFLIINPFFASGVMFYIFLPISIGLVTTVGLGIFTYKLSTKTKLTKVLALNTFSYLLFPLLLWLEKEHQIDFYYPGLGAFFAVVFGIGIIIASNEREQ